VSRGQRQPQPAGHLLRLMHMCQLCLLAHSLPDAHVPAVSAGSLTVAVT
jgi:hypothetical protein